MALYAQIRDVTTTTVNVWLWSDTAGDVVVTLGSVDTTVALDPDVRGGCGLATFAGLTPGTRYNGRAAGPGGAVVIEPRTLPDTGAVTVGVSYCFNSDRVAPVVSQVAARDHDFFVCLGDWIYCDNDVAAQFGETPTKVSADLSYEAVAAYYRQAMKNPHVARWLRRSAIGHVPDDHELPGSNWDGSQGACNAENTCAATQADVDDVWATCMDAADDFMFLGNPPSFGSPDKPRAAQDATPASNYPPRYFTKSIGPHLDVFVLDCTSYKDVCYLYGSSWWDFASGTGTAFGLGTEITDGSGNTATVYKVVLTSGSWAGGDASGKVFALRTNSNPATGSVTWTGGGATLSNRTNTPAAVILDSDVSITMLGSVQLQWLLDALASSTAAYKAILTPKHTYTSSSSGDDWAQAQYQAERDYIIDAITAATGWAKPGGVVWVGGDRHYPGVFASDDHVLVAGGPMGYGYHDMESGYGANTRWKPSYRGGAVWGYSGSQPTLNLGYAHWTELHVPSDGAHLEARIMNWRGRAVWAGRMLPGSNALMYPAVRYG